MCEVKYGRRRRRAEASRRCPACSTRIRDRAVEDTLHSGTSKRGQLCRVHTDKAQYPIYCVEVPCKAITGVSLSRAQPTMSWLIPDLKKEERDRRKSR